MRALQIGMTAAHARAGGVDRYFFNLLRALPQVGVEASGLVVGDPAEAWSAAPGVASFAADDASMLGRWAGLRAAVPETLRNVDLVVSHFAPYALPVLDQIRARPLVVQFHGPWKLESRVEGAGRAKVALQGLLESAVYARARRFIVLSRAFGEILATEYGVARRKIRIVPGGVDIRRFAAPGSRDDARRKLGWPLDRRIVLSVRRLVRAKGIEQFADAIERVRRAVPEVLAIVVGTGPLEADLRQRVSARGLDAHVRFAGHLGDDDLAAAYRAAELFVVPTLALEGFGLVVVEALACGTPVLVTPVGGLPEVVDALEPRLVLRGTTAGDIADGILAALGGSLPLPSEAACIAYAKRFDWPVIAARVRDVYREVA